jgi:hypothetical protein
VEFISRRTDQLNFPMSSLEAAKGMTSEIVQLREPSTGRLVHAGWMRRFKSTGKVIYAGLYSIARVPDEANPCVKVTFPCYGSSSVYLRRSERNLVIHAKNIFLVHIDVKNLMQRTEIAHPPSHRPDHTASALPDVAACKR